MNILIMALLPLLILFCAATQAGMNSDPLKQKVSTVIQQLEKAKFQTVRTEWAHDYGFAPDTGMLNTYEYLISLLSFEDLQAGLGVNIFTHGPHHLKGLDLTNKLQFGHYNPKFVLLFHSAVKQIINDKQLLTSTKASMTTYGLLTKLERLRWIYHYIEANKPEFDDIVADYQLNLAAKSWPEHHYKNAMPEKLHSAEFWNWSEMVYHFWVRREIDGTKELWIEVINDILYAYEHNG